VSKVLQLLLLSKKRKDRSSYAEANRQAERTNFLPPVSKICLALVGTTLLLSCAAPLDRTKQLLELDLAHRSGAIKSLTEQQLTNPDPMQAYSLGVLHGAEGDYEKMNHWFNRCSAQTKTHDGDIAYIRLGHWRDEALAADDAAEAGDWDQAVSLLEKAYQAAPEKSDTWLRLVEARVMAFGPGLEEVRTLMAAERPEVLLRWLERAKEASLNDDRTEARVRLDSQLSGQKNETGDAMANFLLAELCRMDGDWLDMDQAFLNSKKLDPSNTAQIKQIEVIRNSVASQLLKQSLGFWAEDRVPVALAKLDTADVVSPGRAEIFQARRNIIALDGAAAPSRVAEILTVGDLDQRWLAFWMSRLYTKNRLREAGMVANELLRHPDSLNAGQKSQALRVRVAYSRSIGHLNQARDDLRALLKMGAPLPVEAIILGDVLLAQSSYEEALHWYEKAESWGDESVSLILKKARIAFSQDQFSEMEQLALMAAEQDPDNSEVQRILQRARDLISGSEARQ